MDGKQTQGSLNIASRPPLHVAMGLCQQMMDAEVSRHRPEISSGITPISIVPSPKSFDRLGIANLLSNISSRNHSNVRESSCRRILRFVTLISAWRETVSPPNSSSCLHTCFTTSPVVRFVVISPESSTFGTLSLTGTNPMWVA